MAPALDTAALLALLERQELVVVPNAAAASSLRAQFDAGQSARGLRAWEPATALAWNEWVESLWSALVLNGTDDRVLLNHLQEERTWAEIIAHSREGASLSAAASRELGRLSRSALQLAAAHKLLDRLARSADSHDAKAFAAWEQTFAEHCQAARLLPRALLESALAEHLRRNNIVPPPTLHLLGFDSISPAQATLLDAMRPDCEIAAHALQATPRSTQLRASVTLSDSREELLWAARWVRQLFEKSSGSPLKVVLILPNPPAERSELEPLLREILAPELEPLGADISSTPWHFRTGQTLAESPVIQHALLLLRWLREDLPLESAGTLLLSPFFRHSDGYESRARFEMHGLRRAPLLRPELGLPELLQLARRGGQTSRTPASFQEFEAVYRLAGDRRLLKGAGSHGDWTELIRRLLRAAGWPGPRTQTAAEFTVTEAWESLLDLLATLDFSGGRLTFGELFQLLEQEAGTLPAPTPTSGAPLQIMRLEEAEGCCFDAALVLRATDEHLPRPERPHPLLGWGLQQSSGLPGTDSALTHSRSRDALRSLEERCGDVLLLSAKADENGSLRLTPLATELQFLAGDPSSLLPPTAEEPPLTLARVPDTAHLPPLPSPHVHGGARVLELQAACGFRAFASLRLGAALPESRTLGLDARQAGTALHRTMEFFWTEVRTQAALKAMSSDERRTTVERCVSRALHGHHASAGQGDTWATAYLEVFETRLCNLVEQWLFHELQRGDFVVLPPEQGQTVLVGPLELDVRPDRIDSVGDGFVLIDYKTSFALSTKDWLGERPAAPQLPLYALLGEAEEVRGVAFARLRPGRDMAWLSLQDQESLFPGKRGSAVHDLVERVELWREELGRLASDFAAGKTDIDPKTYPQTCKFCDYRPLCRLDASTLLAQHESPGGQDPKEQNG